MSITIRRLFGQDDLTQAIYLLQRFFAEEGFKTLPHVIAANTRKLAALDTCVLLVAEAEGKQIAVATLSLEFGIEYGWGAEMGDLYVLPEWRGKGVSAALVVRAEQFLKSRGASGYQVTVTPIGEQHMSLSKFYDRLGFEDEGRIIRHKKL